MSFQGLLDVRFLGKSRCATTPLGMSLNSHKWTLIQSELSAAPVPRG